MLGAASGKKGKKKSAWETADHWVGLAGPVHITGYTIVGLSGQGAAVNKDEALAAAQVNAKLFTRGDPTGRHLNARRPSLTVETLLDHYYGHVCAKA